MGAKAFENFSGYFGTAGFEDGVKGFEPFLNFYIVDAVGLWGSRGHVGLSEGFVGMREDFIIHDWRWPFFFKK